MIKPFLTIAFLTLILISCNSEKDQLEVVELAQTNFLKSHSNSQFKLPENKLDIIENDMGETSFIESSTRREDVVFKANRMSNQYYLIQKGQDKKSIEEILKSVEGEQLFYFEFSERQKIDILKKYFKDNYEEAIKYLSFNITKDFKLVLNETDTINAVYSTYERNFHVAPFERILLGFNGVSAKDGVKLIYSDNLFKKGAMEFVFPPLEKTTTLTKEIL